MKIHLFHFSPHGMVRAFSHLWAGIMLCRKYNEKIFKLIPLSVNSMTAAWNYCKTLPEYGLQPPCTIIDVGANQSQMSRMLAMPSGNEVRILSFEPNPSLEPIGERFDFALSDVDGFACFVTPDDDADWGTIKAKEPEGNTLRVKTARFDSLVQSGVIDFCSLPKPILVKIDTEGSEFDVLAGFGEYLKQIDYLVVEVENLLSRGGNYTILSLCEFIAANNFKKAKILYSCYDGPASPAYSDIMFWR